MGQKSSDYRAGHRILSGQRRRDGHPLLYEGARVSVAASSISTGHAFADRRRAGDRHPRADRSCCAFMADAAAYAAIIAMQTGTDAGLEETDIQCPHWHYHTGSGGAPRHTGQAADILHEPRERLRRWGPLPRHPDHGQHRPACLATPFRIKGRELFYFLRLLHQRPLHRQRHGTDTDKQDLVFAGGGEEFTGR